MKKYVFKIFSLQNIIALGTLFFGVVFWFWTINGIPKIVNDHEARNRIQIHRNKIIELRAKLQPEDNLNQDKE